MAGNAIGFEQLDRQIRKPPFHQWLNLGLSGLDEEGIEHTAGQNLKKLPEELAKVHEPYDARAREAVTPLAFVEDLRWNQE